MMVQAADAHFADSVLRLAPTSAGACHVLGGSAPVTVLCDIPPLQAECLRRHGPLRHSEFRLWSPATFRLCQLCKSSARRLVAGALVGAVADVQKSIAAGNDML